MNNFWCELFIATAIIFFKSTSGQSTFFALIDESWCGPLDEMMQEYAQNDLNEIQESMRMQIYMRDRNQMTTITDIAITQPDLILKHIDHSKPVVIYIHGYRESPLSESVQTIVKVYLERGMDNILVLDWSEVAEHDYIKLITEVRDVARIFAAMFDELIALGLNLENCHIIGHSLGGQIAGLAGKFSQNSIPRVTGLDPAFPGFYHCDVEHIDKTSARFVDIIYTDRGIYGAWSTTGDVNILPNDGMRPQPGCGLVSYPLSPADVCSHWRSWRYYAESVENIDAFAATQCDNYLNYRLGVCGNNRVIRIGYDIPTDARGAFYLTTNSESPYGQNYL